MSELYCNIGVDWMFDHSLTVEWEEWIEDNGLTLAMSEHGSFLPIVTSLLAEGTVDDSFELPLSHWAVALREDRYVETPTGPSTLQLPKDRPGKRQRVQGATSRPIAERR